MITTVSTHLRRLPALALSLLACGALLSGAADAQSLDAFSSQALSKLPQNSWSTNGGNLFNQRYSPLRSIDRSNVAQLKGVWRTHLRGSGLAPKYSGEAQPLVHDGVIYVITGADDVFALAVGSGKIRWEHAANLDPTIAAVSSVQILLLGIIMLITDRFVKLSQVV